MNTLKQNQMIFVVLFIVLFALLIFHSVLIPGNILFSTDDPLGNIVQGKAQMPYSFIACWSESPFFGFGLGRASLSWNAFWLLLLPATVFKNCFHALNLVGASFFLALFLRERGLGLPAQIIGMLTAFWLGSNFTLVYASHYLKFSTMFLAMAALCCITRAIRQRSLAWSTVSGGVIGLMMLEQQDVALFIGIFWAAFALYEFIRLEGLNIPALFVRFVPMLICALLICGPNLLTAYAANVGVVKDKSSAIDEESPRQKWEFTTQWSWPPEECIDFIAPGYMGWRTGEPEGPYWGRMGRSAGWEETKQGFINFKLENHYLGAIPIFLALFAVCAALIRKRADEQSALNPRDEYRSEIIFWTCAAVVALLLSFGKFFPLYALFYQLPLVSSIRNPNKFLHVFQIAMGILAAYGFDIVARSHMTNTSVLHKQKQDVCKRN
ncbi:MAG: hypothetical protein Q7J98_01520 [Kiritimatiellia bacterium]|nr:hypothetical protein [Kiritimatiellia bacterium]